MDEEHISLLRENRELKKEVKRLRMVVAKLEDARIENVGIHERPALFTAVGEIYQQRLDDLRSEKLEEEEPWTGDAYNPSEDEEFGFGRNDGPRDDN